MYASDLKHHRPALEEKLTQLYTLNRNKTIDLGFRPPFLKLLQQFGNPHVKLPPVIHVAGTNGKGSTIAFLRAMLEAAGYSVHVYTSPHLEVFNERIVLAGETIGDAALEDLVDEALALNNGGDVTFFEITTALAFAAFARTPTDILLLETGLGGRLDCTNIIEKPLVSVITTIDYDHMEFLGETLHAIAHEKAGIIKKNAPCVIGQLGSEAISEGVIDDIRIILKSNESAGFIYGADWFTAPAVDQIRFVFDKQEFILPIPALPGPHQIQNAGAALATLRVIEKNFPVSREAMVQGLKTATWPGRLQRLESGELPALLPAGWELWLDGGHNQSAAKALAAQLERWSQTDSKPVHVILGMMKHKDPKAFAVALLPHIASLTTIAVPGEPSAVNESTLAALIPGAKPGASLREVIAAIGHAHKEPGRVLITGSLYLAGHVLKEGRNKVHNAP